MKEFIKKILAWFGLSNRWKHLTGGILIGLGSNDWYCCLYAGIGVGSAMELKDYLWGGKPDVLDFLLTVIGAVLGYLLRLGLCSIFGIKI